MKNPNLHHLTKALLSFLVVIASGPAACALITNFEFSGRINWILDDKSVLDGSIISGTPFVLSFRYTYDPMIPENRSFSTDPTVAFFPVVSNMTLRIAHLTTEGDERYGPRSVQIWNDRDSGWPHMDIFSVSSGLDYTPPFDLGIGETLVSSFSVGLWDTTGTFLPADILPHPDLVSLSNFNRTYFSFSGLNIDEYRAYQAGNLDTYTSLNMQGSILEIRRIPLPSTLLLLMPGLIGLIPVYKHRCVNRHRNLTPYRRAKLTPCGWVRGATRGA